MGTAVVIILVLVALGVVVFIAMRKKPDEQLPATPAAPTAIEKPTTTASRTETAKPAPVAKAETPAAAEPAATARPAETPVELCTALLAGDY